MKVKLTQTLFVLGCFVVAVSLAARSYADNRTPGKAELTRTATVQLAFQDQPKPKSTAKKKEPAGGRLPNNYAKIGLSDKQRADIYKIQGTYRDQMETLQKQLEDLRTKRDAEVEGVLTAEQKQKLAELKAAAATEAKPATEPKKSE